MLQIQYHPPVRSFRPVVQLGRLAWLCHLVLFAFAVTTFHSCSKVEIEDVPALEPPCAAGEWMSRLDGDTPLCSLSIPGAHDAATATLTTPVVCNYARTQMLSLVELWDVGIRAFDLRPAVGGDGILEIYHSSFSAGITFRECLEFIFSSLDAHPGEFAVVIVRHEVEGDDSDPSWGRLMGEELSRVPGWRLLRSYSPDLRVDDLRGKILLLSRDEYDGGPLDGYVSSWSSSSDPGKWKNGRVGQYPLWVQDYYDPEDGEDKWKAVRGMMEEFSFQGGQTGALCINYCSAYVRGTFGLPSYERSAQVVNLRTARYLAGEVKGPVGIMMMDFAGISRYRGVPVYGEQLPGNVVCANSGFWK